MQNMPLTLKHFYFIGNQSIKVLTVKGKELTKTFEELTKNK